MYKVVGLNENEVMSSESFAEALRILYELYESCIEPIAQGKTPQNSGTTFTLKPKGSWIYR